MDPVKFHKNVGKPVLIILFIFAVFLIIYFSVKEVYKKSFFAFSDPHSITNQPLYKAYIVIICIIALVLAIGAAYAQFIWKPTPPNNQNPPGLNP
ncbi:MAG: hypothetical protein JWM20_718 [Patescibacteria group bacterium]|nr:hypothetical protein [Patescibacteria group bacterium]